MLESKYGKDAIEFVEVKDYTDPAAWDEILKGECRSFESGRLRT